MAIDLTTEINTILRQYSTTAEKGLEKAKQETVKAGVKQLKGTRSPYKSKTGNYNRGWTSKKQGSAYVIYNAKAPGLVHLLENGHLSRNGSMTRSFPHVKNVEQTINDTFEQKVVKELNGYE